MAEKKSGMFKRTGQVMKMHAYREADVGVQGPNNGRMNLRQYGAARESSGNECGYCGT